MQYFISVATIGLSLTACTVDDASVETDDELGESLSASHGDGYGGETNFRAVSYINPDIGAATANPDVAANSGCSSPDRSDTQRLSTAGTADRNVHNDACFLEGGSYGSYGSYGSAARKVDAPATYESSGVGFISACPDPDGAGPKYALTRDRNGDGRIDFCFQSGYQEKGIAGDLEFHARLNNTTQSGTQSVVWCYDSDRDGCSDERAKDRITIEWTR